MEAISNARGENMNTLSINLSNVEVRVMNELKNTSTKLATNIQSAETRLDARINSAEMRISSTEQNYRSMINKFEKLMKDTESRLTSMKESSNMEVDDRGSISRGRPQDRDIAFQLTGILKLKHHLGAPQQEDPQAIIVELMELFDEYHSISRIILVDIKNKTRQSCDTAIVYMSSTYHKQKACSDLRQYLRDYNLSGIRLRDCFDPEEQPRARALNRYGGYLRQEGKIGGYRVINRQGSAVLQTYYGNEKWATYAVNEKELAPYFKSREEREREQQQEQQQQMSSGAATSPSVTASHSQQQQQPRQAQQSRGRGATKGGAGRGAANGGGAARGGANAAGSKSYNQRSSNSNPAVTTHPNNILVAQMWQPSRWSKMQERLIAHEQQRTWKHGMV